MEIYKEQGLGEKMFKIETKSYLVEFDWIKIDHQWMEKQLAITKKGLTNLFKDQPIFQDAEIKLDGFNNGFQLIIKINQVQIGIQALQASALVNQDLITMIIVLIKGLKIASGDQQIQQIYYDLDQNYFTYPPGLVDFQFRQPLFKFTKTQLLKICNYYHSLNQLIYWWSSTDFIQNQNLKTNFNQIIAKTLNCQPADIELKQIKRFSCNDQDQFQITCEVLQKLEQKQVWTELKISKAQLLTITSENLNEIHYYLKHWNWNAIDNFKLVDFPTDSGKLLNLISDQKADFVPFYQQLMKKSGYSNWFISANWATREANNEPWGWLIKHLKSCQQALFYSTFTNLGLDGIDQTKATKLTNWIKVLNDLDQSAQDLEQIVYEQSDHKMWILTKQNNLGTIEWYLDPNWDWNKINWKEQFKKLFELQKSVSQNLVGKKMIIKEDQDLINVVGTNGEVINYQLKQAVAKFKG